MKNKYEIRGDVTAIFLNHKGTTVETIIDTKDLALVDSFPNTWWAGKGCTTEGFYAYCNFRFLDGKRMIYGMHRFITNCPKHMQVDHINHNTLDNRRSNLCIVSRRENTQNFKASARRGSTSGVRGVSRSGNKWRAYITIAGKQINLGRFTTIVEAERVVANARATMMEHSPEAIERRIQNAQ